MSAWQLRAVKSRLILLRIQSISLSQYLIDLLKMVIEGAEYAVIDNLRAYGIRPGQIRIKFHHRFPVVGVAKTKTSVAQRRAMDYTLFHISDSGEMFNFVQKK